MEGSTACGVTGSLYVARAAPGTGPFELDMVLHGGDADHVPLSTGSSCVCGLVRNLGDPDGDWRILGALPADGTPFAERIGSRLSVPSVWACTPGERPPGGVVGPL